MKYLMAILLMVCTAQISAYDEKDLQRFLVINKCPDCDLSYADLSGSISGIDNLTGQDIPSL